MLPDRLSETKSADELLWSLEDQDQDARPVKTWTELARTYLADHRAQAVRSSEYDDKSTDGDFERAELPGFSARSSPTGPQIEHVEDVKAHKEGHLSKERYHRQSSVSSNRREDVEDISRWAKQFIHSERSSPTEHIEEKYKTIDIPFPTKHGSDESSQRSSISFTSYIEAERARERLYQMYPFPPPFKAEIKTKSGEFVTNTCRVHKDSAVAEKSSAEVGHSERNIIGRLERQLDSSQVQKLARKSEMRPGE